MPLFVMKRADKGDWKDAGVLHPYDNPKYVRDNNGNAYILRCRRDDSSEVLVVENSPAKLTSSVLTRKTTRTVAMLRMGKSAYVIDGIVAKDGSVFSMRVAHV